MTETPPQDRVDTDHLRDYSQLRRSLTDRKIAGVAGGLGRHLNIDPTIIRVAFVVLAFFGGAGILLYAAFWLFVPEDGQDQAKIATSPGTRNAVLLVAAAIAALLLLGDGWGNPDFPWPLLVVGVVVLLLLLNRGKSVSTTYPPGTGTYPVQQPPAPRPDRGPLLFWPTVALLAVALGTLGLLDVPGSGIPDAAYPALALTVIGLMLVVGAWFGRPGGLILLGVITSVVLVGTSVAEPRFEGDRVLDETPTTAVQVEDSYFVPAGQIRLDLSNIRDVERLDGRTIEVEANAGEIVVTLPDNLDVDVDADVAVAGEVTILGEQRGGTGVTMNRQIDGGDASPEIHLNLDLVVGSIEVRQ